MNELGPIDLERREGNESFHTSGRDLAFNLLSFWQWSTSDIVSNATRGILAEYIVAQALGIAEGVREEWAAYDLQFDDIRVEVKSAAFIQSWSQKQYSRISFRVPKTRSWDKISNLQSKQAERQADVYVFALLAHKDQYTLDPLDVSQWEFFVAPTVELDNRKRSQHSITLKSLRELSGKSVGFSDLRQAVEAASEVQRESVGKDGQKDN